MQGTISIQKLPLFKSLNLELPCMARDITLKQSLTLSTYGPPMERMFIQKYGESTKTKGK